MAVEQEANLWPRAGANPTLHPEPSTSATCWPGKHAWQVHVELAAAWTRKLCGELWPRLA